MEKTIDIADFVLKSLQELGADSASCIVRINDTTELTAESMKISQLRQVNRKTNILMQAMVGQKKAQVEIGSSNFEDIKKAAADCLEIAKEGKDDQAYAMNTSGKTTIISEKSPAPDLEKLLNFTNQFLVDVEKEFPLVTLRRVTTSHLGGIELYKNTFGTTIMNPISYYKFGSMLLASDEKMMSSYSSTGFSFTDFDKAFIDSGAVRQTLENSTRQIHTSPFGEKKKATLIIAPDCLSGILSQTIGAFMNPTSLISKTSPWQNSLGKIVADSRFSLSIEPENPLIVGANRFTKEGFLTENQPVIEVGRLESLLADLYTSKKTGLEHAKAHGGSLVVKPGEKSLDEIISETESGVIMFRYSGGYVQNSGEFSGIAKNSFIIENGKITNGAALTTVSGNIIHMLKNIQAISKDISTNGSSIMPYIAFNGVTIS